jgi:hypothetical protein
MGNSPCTNTRSQRLQVCGHVGLQCCHYVRVRGSCQFRVKRPTERLVCPHLYLHHLLHYGDSLPGFCAKGAFVKESIIAAAYLATSHLSRLMAARFSR